MDEDKEQAYRDLSTAEIDAELVGFRAQHDRERRVARLRLKYRIPGGDGGQWFIDLALTPEQANSLAAGVQWMEESPEKLMEIVKYVCPNGHTTEREALISNTYCGTCFMEWAQKKFPVEAVVPPEEPK